MNKSLAPWINQYSANLSDDWRFENPCTVSWSEMSPGLFQDFMDGYIKFYDSPSY